MIIMLSMVGPALLIPLYVQNALGLSALLSGLVIMLARLSMVLCLCLQESFTINMGLDR